MRMLFSLAGLLVVLAIVGILTKKQLSTVTQLPAVAAPTSNSGAAPANIAEQSKQIQTQVKDQLNEATKAATEAREKALENGSPDAKTGSAY
jgi:apolipoprotein N-acyltransferase